MAISLKSASQCGAGALTPRVLKMRSDTLPCLTAQDDSLIVHWPEAVRRFSPIKRMNELSWPPGMMEYITKEGPSHVSTCQKISLRAVMKLLSVVCVAGPKHGKSVGEYCLMSDVDYFLISMFWFLSQDGCSQCWPTLLSPSSTAASPAQWGPE